MTEKIDFNNEDLIAYLFLHTNLEQVIFSKELLCKVFSYDVVKCCSNIYLNLLEQHETEKFNNLKNENVFDFEDVLNSLCKDLTENFTPYSVVLFILESKLKAEYKEKNKDKSFSNPLEASLQNPFLQNFFEGLDLNKTEQTFFLTNILNSQWGWLYPTNVPNEVKEENFLHILEKETFTDHQNTRLLNEKFVNLGLFSDFWEPADYVNSYFQNRNQTFTKNKITSDFEMDSVDYKDVLKLNKQDFSIFSKLISKSFENKDSSFELIFGSNDYRIKNFINYCFSEKNFSIKTLSSKTFSGNKKELVFYIYALAKECYIENSILSIDSKYLKELLTEEQDENNIFKQIFSKNNNAIKNFELLSKTKTPIILFYDEPVESNSKIQQLIEALNSITINISFSWKLKLPKENKYFYCAKRFFANNKNIPLSLLKTIVDECKIHKINPENWLEITTLFSHGEIFSKNDVKTLIHNKFNLEVSPKQKKISRYSLEALNTEPKISEIVEALTNAKSWEANQEEKIGCLIKNSGPSGTGKTAFAKEIAKKLDMPLKIVHASDIISTYSGETEQNIKKAFDEATETNSILLFDEADTFLHSRGGSPNRHEDFKVNEFLTQMEEFTGIMICNTNLPENFDKATDRRFNFHVKFNNLTKEGFDILCDTYFKDFSLTENQKEKIFKSGEVTPGDFGNLFKKMHFIAKEKINSEFICQELIRLVKQKNRSFENQNKIGFSI